MTAKQIKKVIRENGFTLNSKPTPWYEYNRYNTTIDIHDSSIIQLIIHDINVGTHVEYRLDEISDFKIVDTWLGAPNELFKEIIIKTTNGSKNWFYIR